MQDESLRTNDTNENTKRSGMVSIHTENFGEVPPGKTVSPTTSPDGEDKLAVLLASVRKKEALREKQVYDQILNGVFQLKDFVENTFLVVAEANLNLQLRASENALHAEIVKAIAGLIEAIETAIIDIKLGNGSPEVAESRLMSFKNGLLATLLTIGIEPFTVRKHSLLDTKTSSVQKLRITQITTQHDKVVTTLRPGYRRIRDNAVFLPASVEVYGPS